jgi:hypothetical protein
MNVAGMLVELKMSSEHSLGHRIGHVSSPWKGDFVAYRMLRVMIRRLTGSRCLRTSFAESIFEDISRDMTRNF